jgi:ABC-type transport system involved in multi-copper enzyme maturation permease subunit
MYRDYCLAMESHEILQQESKGAIAVIRPTPLSIFVKGLDENLRRSYHRGSGGTIGVSSKQQPVNILLELFTTPDLLYVVKTILSLCAMLFAFDMVCGEKEAGTLRQSLSNNLKRPILIFGKWIGGFTSFILPFFIAVLLSTIFLSLSMVNMNTYNLLKLGMFMLSSVIYLAIFFSLGLFISCLSHRTSTSLILSLFVWVILVFLIPNLGNILARQLVQIPTLQQLKLRHTQNWAKKRFMQTRSDNSEYRKFKKRTEEESKQFIDDYRNRMKRLVKVSQNITRISPAAAFTFLATDIMGTGLSEERRLKRAILHHDGGNMDYQRSSIKEALGPGGLSNGLILILFNVLFFSGAYVIFMRYDAR